MCARACVNVCESECVCACVRECACLLALFIFFVVVDGGEGILLKLLLMVACYLVSCFFVVVFLFLFLLLLLLLFCFVFCFFVNVFCFV